VHLVATDIVLAYYDKGVCTCVRDMQTLGTRYVGQCRADSRTTLYIAVPFSSPQLQAQLFTHVNSIKNDKHFVHSCVTNCLNPAINTQMSCAVAVGEHYQLDQHQCTHLQLFRADMYIIRVHIHTKTHL
jgi:hypothetical protein